MSSPDRARVVHLRAERDGPDRRFLDAYIQYNQLIVSGKDLGPATASVSGDGEYEWFRTVRRADIPALVAELGGSQGEDVLDVLERTCVADGGYALEQLLRDGVVPSEVHVV